MPAARTVVVEVLGNTASLELALERAGVVAQESSKSIQKAALDAGRATQAQAAEAGKSADEQIAAASRAAAASVEGAAKMTQAQRAVAAAAAQSAKALGLSAEETKTAVAEQVASQRALEDSIRETAVTAKASAAEQVASAKMVADESEVSAARIGTTFEAGTARASSALTRLGNSGASWGIPLSGSLTKMGGQLDSATTKGERFVATMSAAGKLTLGVAAIGGLAAAVEGVRGAIDLEKQMERLHTQAGSTQPQVHTLTAGVLGMAGNVGKDPKELAEGMYHVVSALNATTAPAERTSKELKVLEVAAKGAGVGGASVSEEANALDAALVSGVGGIHSYGQAMGALNKTVGAGDMSMEQLAQALASSSGLTSRASLAGVTFQQLGGALAVLGDNLIRGRPAATSLASAIRIMAAPTEAAGEALGSVGIKTHELAQDMRTGGIVKALEDLKAHLHEAGAGANETEMILSRAFGGRQSTGISILLNQLERLKLKTAEVESGGNKFYASYAAYTHTLAFQEEQLKSTTKTLADEFGMFLIPKLEATGKAISAVIAWMEKHKQVAEELGIAIGTVLGLAVLTFATQKVAAFVTGIGKMGASMLGLSGTAEATAGKVAASGDAIVASSDETAAGVDTAIGSTGIGAVLIALTVGAAELATHWEQSWNLIKSVAQDAANFIIGKLNTMLKGIETLTLGLVHVGKIGEVNLNPYSLSNRQIQGGEKVVGAVSKASQHVLSTGGGIMGYFMSKGLSPAQAAGIVGNFQQESSLNPNMSYSGGSGLDSGLGSRAHMGGAKKELEAYWKELVSEYPSVLAQLKRARSPQEAARIFETGFEKAGQPEMGTREKFAVEAYKAHPQKPTVSDFAPKAVTGSEGAINAALKKTREEYEHKSSSTSSSTSSKTVAALGIPAAVATMLKTATSLVGANYTSGGGHAGWDPIATLKQIGIDCSGFVSQVLHSGGAPLSSPLTTEGLASTKALARGPGKYVTVFDRANAGSDSHALIEILGHFFESGGSSKYNPSGGVSMLTAKQARGELSQGPRFFEFHPTGGLNTAVRGGVSQSTLLQTSGVNSASMIATAHEEARREHETVRKREETKHNSYTTQVMGELGGHLGAPASKFVKEETKLINERAKLEKALNTEIKSLDTKGRTLLKKYQSDIQSGSVTSLEKALGVTAGHPEGKGSVAHGEYRKLVGEVYGPGGGKQGKEIVEKLTAAHKEALKALDTELAAKWDEGQARIVAAEATGVKDETGIAQAASNRVVEAMKDAADKMAASVEAMAAGMKDAGQTLTDAFSAVATQTKDRTAEIASASQAKTVAIEDKSQTEVDKLSERGLYGLNLTAEQQQVALDETKSGYDKQIGQAEQAIAATRTATDKSGASVQALVDATKTQQDILVGGAKTHLAQVEGEQHTAENTAKEHLATVTKTTDAAVEAATAGVAQAATESKAKQDEAAAQLKLVESGQKFSIAEAEASVVSVESVANAAIQLAQGALSSAEGQASVAEGEAENALAAAHGNSEVVLAQAEAVISTLQGQAGVSEAEQKAIVEKTREEANTQYAGSGLVVNITGLEPGNAAAVAAEMGWLARTVIPVS